MRSYHDTCIVTFKAMAGEHLRLFVHRTGYQPGHHGRLSQISTACMSLLTVMERMQAADAQDEAA